MLSELDITYRRKSRRSQQIRSTAAPHATFSSFSYTQCWQLLFIYFAYLFCIALFKLLHFLEETPSTSLPSVRLFSPHRCFTSLSSRPQIQLKSTSMICSAVSTDAPSRSPMILPISLPSSAEVYEYLSAMSSWELVLKYIWSNLNDQWYSRKRKKFEDRACYTRWWHWLCD